MTTARISERKTSVIEKHIPMAAGRDEHRFGNENNPEATTLTLNCAFDSDLLFRVVEQHHQLRGCE